MRWENGRVDKLLKALIDIKESPAKFAGDSVL